MNLDERTLKEMEDLVAKRRSEAIEEAVNMALRTAGQRFLNDIRLFARGIDIHPGLSKALAKAQPEPNTKDPWAEVARKFGLNFPKRGVATYAIKYIALVAMVKETQRFEAVMAKEELKSQMIGIELNEFAKTLGCTIDEVIPTLRALALVQPLIGIKLIELEPLMAKYKEHKTLTEEVRKMLNETEVTLQVHAGFLVTLSERIPEKPNGFVQAIALGLWKMLGGPMKADFEEARIVANAFLRASIANPKIDEIAK